MVLCVTRGEEEKMRKMLIMIMNSGGFSTLHMGPKIVEHSVDANLNVVGSIRMHRASDGRVEQRGDMTEAENIAAISQVCTESPSESYISLLTQPEFSRSPSRKNNCRSQC